MHATNQNYDKIKLNCSHIRAALQNGVKSIEFVSRQHLTLHSCTWAMQFITARVGHVSFEQLKREGRGVKKKNLQCKAIGSQ